MRAATQQPVLSECESWTCLHGSSNTYTNNADVLTERANYLRISNKSSRAKSYAYDNATATRTNNILRQHFPGRTYIPIFTTELNRHQVVSLRDRDTRYGEVLQEGSWPASRLTRPFTTATSAQCPAGSRLLKWRCLVCNYNPAPVLGRLQNCRWLPNYMLHASHWRSLTHFCTSSNRSHVVYSNLETCKSTSCTHLQARKNLSHGVHYERSLLSQ